MTLSLGMATADKLFNPKFRFSEKAVGLNVSNQFLNMNLKTHTMRDSEKTVFYLLEAL